MRPTLFIEFFKVALYSLVLFSPHYVRKKQVEVINRF